ncbi:MAG: signal peptide peptidase SppA [Deltaproteobacteria bacterium]|nr:signal peptide peptidase SppA [Deltaproteobacteria bacterium]
MLVSTLRAVLNLLRIPFLPLFWLSRLFGRPRGDWIHVRISPRLAEFAGPRPFFLRFFPALQKALPTPLGALRRLADRAVADDRVRGVVFEIPPLLTGWAGASALRRIMATLRAGEVQVAAYLPQGGGNREMWIAAAADHIVLGPQATLMALGLSAESRYLKPLLDKIGVAVESTARREYKTATETLTRESMSEPQREQVGALLDTIDGELRGALSARMGVADADADVVFERGFMRGAEAVELGFADAIAYDDELPNVLGTSDKPAKLVPGAAYLAFQETRFFARVLPRPYVGVVEVHGAIGIPGRGADPEAISAALRVARRDRFCVGVVIHVDSPGGSALASDQIHREVVRLKEKKPVAAFMGNVAASGGYYVAAPADVIIAEAVTVTGSIGVIMTRFVARNLFETLGVRTEVMTRAPHAAMFSPARELSDGEQAILDREADGFYQAFVTIVAEGRGRSFEEVEPLARGRVWSGKDAEAHGLVDRLGGIEDAISHVRSHGKTPSALWGPVEARPLRPRRRSVPPAPAPQGPSEASSRAVARAAASALMPGAGDALDILDLLGGPDRALYWAASIPEVW